MPMITADDLDNLRHMLGISGRRRGGFRNYFVAGGDDVASMERLRDAGFVVKNERYMLSADPCYHATIEGQRAVGLAPREPAGAIDPDDGRVTGSDRA